MLRPRVHEVMEFVLLVQEAADIDNRTLLHVIESGVHEVVFVSPVRRAVKILHALEALVGRKFDNCDDNDNASNARKEDEPCRLNRRARGEIRVVHPGKNAERAVEMSEKRPAEILMIVIG